MTFTKFTTKILAISLASFMTACVQYESGAVSGAQPGVTSDPDGREPSVAAVQVTLELYGEKKVKNSN